MPVDAASEASADWWRRWPGLYQSELDAFARRGAQTTVAVENSGILILDVEWPGDEKPIRLLVGFSPLHPFCRASVRAPDLHLPRHQNPLDQGLCLITQASGEWDPSQRVADLIFEQLERIFSANRARAEERWGDAAQVEENVPDPIAAYYASFADDDAAVFFDGDQRMPQSQVGFARFGVKARAHSKQVFEAVLQRVEPARGQWLASTFSLAGPHDAQTEVMGRWVRVRPPASVDARKILDSAEAAIVEATALQPALQAKMKALGEAPFTITGLLFEEELAYGPNRTGDGWLFLASTYDQTTGLRTVSLVQGYRVTDGLQVRVPVASALKARKVLLVGAGAIGSFVAVELARAGIGHLTLLDFDVVEPGNSVRWPLGQPFWGVRKVVALRDFIERNYTHTAVVALDGQLGASTTDLIGAMATTDHPLTHLRKLIAGSDIVVDATASTECQQALAFNCREMGTPYVVGYATEGAAGGVVARFPPGSHACFVCMQDHWRDGSIPLPPVDPTGTVVPVGCNRPAFTGAAFDLQEVSLELVRSTVSALASEGYSRGSWQVAVLALRKEGEKCLPQWEGASLSPRCSGCVEK